jgi:hypothetical protein
MREDTQQRVHEYAEELRKLRLEAWKLGFLTGLRFGDGSAHMVREYVATRHSLDEPWAWSKVPTRGEVERMGVTFYTGSVGAGRSPTFQGAGSSCRAFLPIGFCYALERANR